MMEVRYIHNTLIHNSKAAEIIVPIILKRYRINSVVDIGCGTGTWLSVFDKYGIKNIGIDGDYVDRSLLCIKEDNFKSFDLNKRFSLNEKYDLAICLEVAEHLEIQSAISFIECLTSLSDLIIFSAAIPCQGGQNHINEQYPDYWFKIFESLGYYLVDDLKADIWGRPDVEWWYQQNIMVFKKNANSTERKKLFFAIHPGLYKTKIDELKKFEMNYKKTIMGHISFVQLFKIIAKKLINLVKPKQEIEF